MSFDVLPSAKTSVPLTIDGYNTVTLPDDCISVISVGVEYNDKIRTLFPSDKLNPRDTGSAFPTDELNPLNDDTALNYGREWERGTQFEDTYRVLEDAGKLRIDNRLTEVTEVIVRYIAEPAKINSQSVIHPFAQEALYEFIAWKWAKYHPNNRFDPQIKKRDFDNAYRILRGRRNKMSTKSIIRSIRASRN